jgi:hypothetical protein
VCVLKKNRDGMEVCGWRESIRCGTSALCVYASNTLDILKEGGGLWEYG